MLKGRRHRESFTGSFGFLFVCLFVSVGLDPLLEHWVRPKEEVITHYLPGTPNDWAVSFTMRPQVPGG